MLLESSLKWFQVLSIIFYHISSFFMWDFYQILFMDFDPKNSAYFQHKDFFGGKQGYDVFSSF